MGMPKSGSGSYFMRAVCRRESNKGIAAGGVGYPLRSSIPSATQCSGYAGLKGSGTRLAACSIHAAAAMLVASLGHNPYQGPPEGVFLMAALETTVSNPPISRPPL